MSEVSIKNVVKTFKTALTKSQSLKSGKTLDRQATLLKVVS
jgi:hypothetical protein